MSGLEVAGLALGAFPVLLRLLDDYRKGAEAMGDWWQIRRAHAEWKQDLDYHRTAFELNSKLILMPVMEEDELDKFLADPTGGVWKNNEWESRLRQRLPDSYNAVIIEIMSVYDVMEKLKEELGVHNADLLTMLNQNGRSAKGKAAVKYIFSAENIDFQKERFRLVSKKQLRERLSVRLKESNDRLRDLISGSDQVAAARRDREFRQPPPKANKKLNEYWRHAKGLYEALSRASSVDPSTALCRCTDHAANLQLADKHATKTEFGVLLCGMQQDGNLTWNETRIEMISKETAAIATDSIQQTITGRPTKRARRAIRDLCSELCKPPRACIGFMEEDEQRYVVYPDANTLGGSDFFMITLDSVLYETQSLTRHQRYRLAHTIAIWFLRLGATPWINLPLQANIGFFQDTAIASHKHVNIDKLFIGGLLSSRAPTPIIAAIRSLGVCLLELCFGCSLESYKVRSGLSGGTGALAALLDHAAAIQWSDDVLEEAGPYFDDAIKWCLQARNSIDESWRTEIWSQVIVPLTNCSNHVSQKPVF